MKKAFTLIELLVVIAIIGLMGSMAVGGYRQMQRGIEERGALQNASQFIRSAYQRAQIDRAPTAVYFWNETLREETDNDTMIVVGRAVAVRRAGRISAVVGKLLCDEFGDLVARCARDEDGVVKQDGDEDDEGNHMFLYQMNSSAESGFRRSTVLQSTVSTKLDALLLLSGEQEKIPMYAFKLKDPGGCTWKTGDAYGFEFAEIQLPHGYIFGSTYSKDVKSPVQEVSVLRFKVSGNSGSGSRDGTTGPDSVEICSIRPGPSGETTAMSVGKTESPTKELN